MLHEDVDGRDSGVCEERHGFGGGIGKGGHSHNDEGNALPYLTGEDPGPVEARQEGVRVAVSHSCLY